MRAVIQRVSESRVVIAGRVAGEIGPGLLVLLGVGQGDDETDVAYLADKIVNLRIFKDEDDRMNLSVLETSGEILVVSQFTLFGDCRRGRRPGYSTAALPEEANRLYRLFVESLKSRLVRKVEEGEFQAHMEVSLINDGPVTLLIDSRKQF
ncbi:MAG: D-aminoacyl-tRNA deacylase [bacterium]